MLSSEDKCDLINELFSQYRQKMYKQALSMVEKPEDAEDMLQIAFLKIIRHLEKISRMPAEGREGYLIKAIKRICFDYNKKKKKCTYISDIDESVIDVGSLVTDAAVLNMSVNEIKEALNDLSERDRNILYFKLFEGYKAKDIAEKLKIPTRNINVYIKRANDRLLKVLRKRGITNDF